MSSTTASRKVTITAARGLQPDKAAQFVNEAQLFSSDIITLAHAEQSVDAKSLSNVQTLDLADGAEVTISVEGEDAEVTVDYLATLMTELA